MQSIKYLMSSAVLVIILTGCAKTQSNESDAFTWEVSAPEAEGIDGAIIDSLHRDLQSGSYGLVDHFLLIRNGKIVADHHYDHDYKTISQIYDTARHQYNYDHPDWHPYYQYSDLHSLQSVTKTVTSILLGIAKDQGMSIHLDSAILPLFGDYNIDRTDKLKMSITLHDLLTMRSGILWDESSSYADDSLNNCTAMELKEDWIQYVLDRPMDTIPGTKWVYNSGVSVLLGKIVSIATGKGLDTWAEEKLFGPLGITDYYWKKTPLGEVDSEGGLYLKPHDLARIALMVLQKGQWQGQQIVSEEWLKQSVEPFVSLSDQVGYGFQWWLTVDGDETIAYDMNGYGGQFVNIIPASNMIVVFNGWNIHESNKRVTLNFFKERILPAIKSDN
ncbi:MAG: serine hydrolase [Cyclobacteriaceae bacterium]